MPIHKSSNPKPVAKPRTNPVPRNQRRPGKSFTRPFSVQAGSHGSTHKTSPTHIQKMTVLTRKNRCIQTGGGGSFDTGGFRRAVAEALESTYTDSSCSEAGSRSSWAGNLRLLA